MTFCADCGQPIPEAASRYVSRIDDRSRHVKCPTTDTPADPPKGA